MRASAIHRSPFSLTAIASLAALASLCGCSAMSTMKPYDQAALPAAVQVPTGHRVAMETVGVGEITYECRAKAAAPGSFEWVFVGPKAVLNARSGSAVGSYFGPPATWQASDGSAITGAQVAVAPHVAGSIPLQLVKANQATGSGAMSGISYVQRVATRGGVAPANNCAGDSLGKREIVKYQADYIFWKAA
jgi:hypothetical protein